MPPRNPELPEGTDHIVNGALDTSGGGTGGGGAGSGFVGSSTGDDTGGTRTGGDLRAQLRDGASNVQRQAGEKFREYAETGKGRATTALDDFSKVVNDAASSIDDRLGAEYGEYARRAADAVSGFADTLRNKQVDELIDDGRALVRRSPGVAIGVAAVVGFTLVRLVKSGFESQGSGQNQGERDIRFEPDTNINAGGGTTTTTGTTGTGI